MARFVADASVTLPWCFEDKATAWTDGLLFGLRTGDEAVVPAHWPVEVLNALLFAVRRGRMVRDKVERFWNNLSALPIQVERPNMATGSTIYALAEQYRLTVYDAAYLELAWRAGWPIATLGSDLRKAAKAAGARAIADEHKAVAAIRAAV